MATTVTAYAQSNSVSAGAGWDNPTNAYADDGTYATKTIVGSGTHGNRFYNFGFNIPSNALVLDVIMEFQHKTSGTNAFIYYTIGAGYGTIASAQIEEATTDTTTTRSTASRLTPTEVNDNSSTGLGAVVNAVNGGSGTFTYNIDYVKISVTYITPTGLFDVKYPTSLGGTLWTSSDNVKVYDASSASTVTSKEMYGYGFGFSIPDGAIVNGIYFYARAARITAGNTITIQAGYDGTKRGTAYTPTLAMAGISYLISDIGSWTISELNNSLMQFYLKSSTASCDCLYIVVDYTPPSKGRFAQII